MYSKITKYLKEFLQSTINADDVQVAFFGDFQSIDLRKPAILIEPRKDSKAAKNTRWKDSTFQVRIWVMSEIYRDYMISMEEIENIIGAENDETGEKVGLMIALDKLKKDLQFSSMAGSMGSKQWRILSNAPLDYSDVTWGINQRSSSRINTAQVDLTIHMEQEK